MIQLCIIEVSRHLAGAELGIANYDPRPCDFHNQDLNVYTLLKVWDNGHIIFRLTTRTHDNQLKRLSLYFSDPTDCKRMYILCKYWTTVTNKDTTSFNVWSNFFTSLIFLAETFSGFSRILKSWNITAIISTAARRQIFQTK